MAWFHPFSGFAGDMALASLLDAGAELDMVLSCCRAVLASGWDLTAEKVERSTVMATYVNVEVDEGQPQRDYAQIRELIATATMPRRVADRSLAVFTALANAEARIHGIEPEHVHFHEVGAVDSIVDVVGVCAALESLGIEEIHSAPVVNGHGEVESAHGVLPVPAPAVLELLRGLPVRGVDIRRELTTPTGAALLATLVSAWGGLPEVMVEAVGHGAGTAEIERRPNVCQVVIGPRSHVASEGLDDRLLVLEANVDDATGEVLAHTLRRLLDAGARDAWLVPIVMKKGRPAHVVSALVDIDLANDIREVLVSETGTLGVRSRLVSRWAAPRQITSVTVAGYEIRMKVADHRAEAEFDDAAAAAEQLGIPVRDVLARAEARWRERADTTPSPN